MIASRLNFEYIREANDTFYKSRTFPLSGVFISCSCAEDYVQSINTIFSEYQHSAWNSAN